MPKREGDARQTAALPGHAFQQSCLLVSSISCPHTSCFSGSALHTELLFCQLPEAPSSSLHLVHHSEATLPDFLTPCQQRPVLLNCLLLLLSDFREITTGSQPPFSPFPSLFATYQPTAEPQNPLRSVLQVQTAYKNTRPTCYSLRSTHNTTFIGKAPLPVGHKTTEINFIHKTTTFHYF